MKKETFEELSKQYPKHIDGDYCSDRRTKGVLELKKLEARISEKNMEIEKLVFDIEALKAKMEDVFKSNIDGREYWKGIDYCRENKTKDMSYYENLLVPKGAKEVFFVNVEENIPVAGRIEITFFFKERYFKFELLGPENRKYNPDYNFGFHSAEIFVDGTTPYSEIPRTENICWSFDIEEIKASPEKYLKEIEEKEKS